MLTLMNEASSSRVRLPLSCHFFTDSVLEREKLWPFSVGGDFFTDSAFGRGKLWHFFPGVGGGGERWYCCTDVVFGRPFFPGGMSSRCSGGGNHDFSCRGKELVLCGVGAERWYLFTDLAFSRRRSGGGGNCGRFSGAGSGALVVLRRFSVGRKLWLFSGGGGGSGAVVFLQIECW